MFESHDHVFVSLPPTRCEREQRQCCQCCCWTPQAHWPKQRPLIITLKAGLESIISSGIWAHTGSMESGTKMKTRQSWMEQVCGCGEDGKVWLEGHLRWWSFRLPCFCPAIKKQGVNEHLCWSMLSLFYRSLKSIGICRPIGFWPWSSLKGARSTIGTTWRNTTSTSTRWCSVEGVLLDSVTTHTQHRTHSHSANRQRHWQLQAGDS